MEGILKENNNMMKRFTGKIGDSYSVYHHKVYDAMQFLGKLEDLIEENYNIDKINEYLLKEYQINK